MLMLILAAVYGISKFLNFLYIDVDGSEWSRIMMHYFYEEDNIDNLYLGSSHVFFNLNPKLMDELSEKDNFNMATTSQELSGSYYMLKEALEYHEIERVYVEVYCGLSTEESTDMNRVWRCTDYMNTFANRLEYVWTNVPAGQWVEAIFPFVRYRSSLFDLEYINNQLERKLSYVYEEHVYRKYNNGEIVMAYMPKGYCYSDSALQQDTLMSREHTVFSENPLTDNSLVYLRKLIQLCKDEEIELVLFSAPVYELKMLTYEEYDAYVEQLRSIASEYGVEYYDFNLAKEEFFDIQETENFFDLHHLNSKGAEQFTEFFYEVMQRTPEENEKYFFETYAKKLEEQSGRVYGLYYVEDKNKQSEKWKIASTWEEGMEYRVFLTPQYGKSKMIQDFSDNPYITIPKKEDGICTIISRRIGEEGSVSTLEVRY